jgi:hypothetical protein
MRVIEEMKPTIVDVDEALEGMSHPARVSGY